MRGDSYTKEYTVYLELFDKYLGEFDSNSESAYEPRFAKKTGSLGRGRALHKGFGSNPGNCREAPRRLRQDLLSPPGNTSPLDLHPL